MPILSYQQIVNSLRPDDIEASSPEIICSLMRLFSREKATAGKVEAASRSIYWVVVGNNSLFASLPGHISPEYFLSYLSIEEKRAVQKIAFLLARGVQRIEKYPKFHSLFAVGSSTYTQEHRQDLASAATHIKEAVVGPKAYYEEYWTTSEFISKAAFMSTIENKGNDIDLILTGMDVSMKTTMKERQEYREYYLKEVLPALLTEHNIAFTYEEERNNWSSYYVYPENNLIHHTKYLERNTNKQGTLIITFPNCRPIHLDVVAESMPERYEQEDAHTRSFALLFNYTPNHEILETIINDSYIKQIPIPEHMSVEEKMNMVRSYKQKIDWAWIEQARQMRNSDKKQGFFNEAGNPFCS
jgi:hypothetical protein